MFVYSIIMVIFFAAAVTFFTELMFDYTTGTKLLQQYTNWPWKNWALQQDMSGFTLALVRCFQLRCQYNTTKSIVSDT